MAELGNTYSLSKLTLTKVKSASGSSDTTLNTTSISLVGSFVNVVIYHSIDEVSNSGYVSIREQGNLLKTFPIVGWEKLEIAFSVKDASGNKIGDEYSRTFYVYAVDEMAEDKDVKTYCIRFCSLEALYNVCARLEHRYKGKAEVILAEIAGLSLLGEMQLETDVTTKYELDYVASSLKPFDFMSRITGFAVSANGTFADCLLFQQVDGTYHFTSYATMFSDSVINFYRKPRLDTSISSDHIINDYSINQLFNTQLQAINGLYGNITKVFDYASMTPQTYVNYYASGDEGNSNPTYAVAPIEKISEKTGDPEYVITLLSQYQSLFSDSLSNSGSMHYAAYAMGPGACISQYIAGMAPDDITRSVAGSDIASETIKHAYGTGIPCNQYMRTKSAIFTLNPCTDLKLGARVLVQNATTSESEKTDISTIAEFIAGYWYIGKIKYTLTIDELSVDVQCFSPHARIAKFS